MRTNKASALINTLYKSYLYRSLFRDVSRFAKRNLPSLSEFDRDHLLHKAGLARYRPAATTSAAIGMVMLGACIGAVVGLALAPKPGEQLRADVRDKAAGIFNRSAGALGQEARA